MWRRDVDYETKYTELLSKYHRIRGANSGMIIACVIVLIIEVLL